MAVSTLVSACPQGLGWEAGKMKNAAQAAFIRM